MSHFSPFSKLEQHRLPSARRSVSLENDAFTGNWSKAVLTLKCPLTCTLPVKYLMRSWGRNPVSKTCYKPWGDLSFQFKTATDGCFMTWWLLQCKFYDTDINWLLSMSSFHVTVRLSPVFPHENHLQSLYIVQRNEEHCSWSVHITSTEETHVLLKLEIKYHRVPREDPGVHHRNMAVTCAEKRRHLLLWKRWKSLGTFRSHKLEIISLQQLSAMCPDVEEVRQTCPWMYINMW